MDIPRFDLGRILGLREQLFDQVFLERLHTTPEGADLEGLVNVLMRHLHGAVQFDALFETVRQLAGVELTRQLCQEFSWRLAGNLPTLAAGQVVVPWTAQLKDEWFPFQVSSVTPAYNARQKKPGYRLALRVLAGSPAGVLLSQFWSVAKCRAFSRRLGFSPPWGKYPYHDAHQYVSMRFLGFALAEKSRDDVWFEEFAFPQYCLTSNRELLKRRYKIIPCPHGFGDRLCHRCPVGYVDCPAGTHRETYVFQMCPKCQGEKFFDPASSSPHCVDCTHREQHAAS